MVLLAGALLWWIFNTGQEYAGFDRAQFEQQLTEANNLSRRISGENAELKSSLDRLQQQAQIERAAQIELSLNITQLQEENANLKEEVSFFRNIMSSGKVSGGLSIQNFRIEGDVLPNEYRFYALLVQGGQRDRDFVGKAQLIVTGERGGVATAITYPESDDLAPTFDVKLKYYQRLEGRFKAEPGTVLKSIQLRIIERATGQVRSTRSLSLS
ncbi:MAG TPA: DUF6776 family protein [Burkholderiales bacterium]|nr:DUF6776 family protein [Burkholderiales bacterium]